MLWMHNSMLANCYAYYLTTTYTAMLLYSYLTTTIHLATLPCNMQLSFGNQSTMNIKSYHVINTLNYQLIIISTHAVVCITYNSLITPGSHSSTCKRTTRSILNGVCTGLDYSSLSCSLLMLRLCPYSYSNQEVNIVELSHNLYHYMIYAEAPIPRTYSFLSKWTGRLIQY